MVSATQQATSRLLSLDVFRGITIAAMILVNNPGSWSHAYAPLLHTKWHGCTFTDLIFPFFLFMVGLAVSLRPPASSENRTQIALKVLKRSIILVLLGLFLNAVPSFDFSTIRIPGVLQRIGLVFLVVALFYHYIKIRIQILFSVGILFLYWILMVFVPVPDSGISDLQPGTDWGAWLDRHMLSGHLWKYSTTWDPEGLLSTLPAIVTGFLGVFSGKILFGSDNKVKSLLTLLAFATVLIVVGLVWEQVFPINKSLWTSSYVLFTGGIAVAFYAVLYWLLDCRKWLVTAFYPFRVFGSNAITAFVLSGLIAKYMGLIELQNTPVKALMFDYLTGVFVDWRFASLVFALGFVLVCYWPIWWMYKRAIFIRI